MNRDNLRETITQAFDYLSNQSIEIPVDLLTAFRKKAVKSAADAKQIRDEYKVAITAALLLYFDGYEVIARNNFNTATVNAFTDTLEQGWMDGGEDLPVDDETQAWFDARLAAELAFIALLFAQASELSNDPEFDAAAWIEARALGYSNTLIGIYNNAKMRAMPNQMVTFDGDDGKESCPDCQMLKGKRHKISWFVQREYVPPFGRGLECHPGGRCQHGLFDDSGKQVTI